jgi:predicted pyridoxine 5'-phosphate oxidase superfamily flavin-nucleotide-binding protein
LGHQYAKTMFTEAVRRQQQQRGSRGAYERIAQSGASHDTLRQMETEFIAARDSFYMASVNPDGWPYIQHRGGPTGFLKVLDPTNLAFADYAGNQQYISAGNFATNDRVSLFLMSYPEQARLKILGHAQIIAPDADPALAQAVRVPGYRATVERIVKIQLVAFDWNCTQHITPRYTLTELEEAATAAV